MQILQQPDKITILYYTGHQVRRVRMNQPHPQHATASWYGDSVGHYERDTLVIDTVGIKVGPYSGIDIYGTPHTEGLHVVERYRLLDYEAAKEAQERGEKENRPIPASEPTGDGVAIDADYKGKGLQLEFTVEDQGVFTTPWSALITYRRRPGVAEPWQAQVFALAVNLSEQGISPGPNGRPRLAPNSKLPRIAANRIMARIIITTGWPVLSAWRRPRASLTNRGALDMRRRPGPKPIGTQPTASRSS
jgi:hypothetical protein